MAKAKFNARLVLFDQESREVRIERVEDTNSNMVESASGVFDVSHAVAYVDPRNKEMVYVVNADLPAKVEAENLKTLRRSVVLKRLFDFERSPGQIDWAKVAPYVIIALLIFFR